MKSALIMHGLSSADAEVLQRRRSIRRPQGWDAARSFYFPADESGEAASISLTPETEVMYPGSSKQFTADVKEAKDPTVDWRVSEIPAAIQRSVLWES